MEITLAHTLDAFASDEWNALLKNAQTNTVFQTLPWQRAWIETIGRNQPLFIVKVVDQGSLVGIAPLTVTRKGSMRILKFIGYGHSDYCDFIYERLDVLEAIIKFLKDNHDKWDAIALDYIPHQSATVNRLSALCSGQKLFVNAYAKHTGWYLHLDKDKRNLHALMERKSFQRDYKSLIKQGNYQVLHLRESEEINSWLNEFFDQHIRRRESLAVKSLFLNESNKRFYQSMVKFLGLTGWMVLTVIMVNQKAVAFHLGWIYNGTLMYYKPSYDPQWSKYSPGDALLMESFKYFLDQDLCEFDFGPGNESYKIRYANGQRGIVSFKVFQSQSLAWAGKFMDAVKGLIKK